MNGHELCIQFSYITNVLQYCGPQCSEAFKQYLREKNNKEAVEEAFKKFEGLYPYLTAIAKKHNKHFLDYDVVEAYWIGNKLLDAFTDDDVKDIIRLLMTRGLPKSIGEELITKMPTGFVPHHAFNVFYVGVGRITSSVDVTLQNMDNCRPSWGKVLEILPDKLLVQTQPLVKKDKIELGEEETKTIIYHKEFLQPKIGDIVALHWGFACAVLTEDQVKRLEHYTNKILALTHS